MTTANKGILLFLGAGLLLMLGTALYARLTSPSLVKQSEAQRMIPAQQQTMPDAIGAMMNRVSANPNDAATLLQLSKLLIQNGNGDAALDFLDRAAQVDDKNSEIPYLQGYIRHAEGKHQDAAAFMEKSLALSDSAAVRFSLGVIYKYFLKDNTSAERQWKQGLSSPDAGEELKKHMQEELEKLQPARPE